MNLDSLVGETLDAKYKIERELGRGGMGAVYLSTHIGTERPVAVKVIVPQFMQRAEFVERFRREARAAGRLRHPNVVDVTDFGIAETNGGRVAYLVMEYLDGCTLGEILEEEKKLPLAWTLDILEQVSSAVQEAHNQGIIHRDLKPDNIWLEPNQRGGYTVKVLDFGIAKLETASQSNEDAPNFQLPASKARQTQIINENGTNADDKSRAPTTAEKRGATVFTEKQTVIEPKQTAVEVLAPKIDLKEVGTLIQSAAKTASEVGTAILPAAEITESDNIGTKILTEPADNIGTKILTEQENLPAAAQEIMPTSAALTSVGAVLGTPLYMSPEQCRGERLDARSDIYSLGVITYQMLAGKTPFEGNFTDVMQAHKETAPPALEAKKVPRKVKRVINSALAKNAAERPASAQAFISRLRAQSEGIGTLFQRALVIYSEHLPKFLLLSVLLYLPVIVLNILQVTVEFVSLGATDKGNARNIAVDILGIVSAFCVFFCVYLIHGTTIWLVTQIMTFPLRPVALRPALQATRRKWKSLIRTGFLSTGLTFLGLLACGIGFPILSVLFALVAPVVMMENLRGKAALKRSVNLVRRSLATVAGTMAIMFLVPIFFSSVIATFVAMSYETFKDKDEPPAVVSQQQTAGNGARNSNMVVKTDDDREISINIGADKNIQITEKDESGNLYKRLKRTIRDASIQILMLPFSILIGSFSSIVISLLYLKTRQAGGESIQNLLLQFQENDQPHSNWQKRARERLIQSGRVTSRS